MALNRVSRVDDRIPIRKVLISVSDKTGLETFAEGLLAVNPSVVFYSTGGTFDKLAEILGSRAKNHLVAVSDYTGQPEMQGGLVKTLDFKIYMGLLSETYNPDHKNDLARTSSVEFDLVAVNLYPFQKTVAQAGCTLEDARANIDIGGPCMLRAGAKNYLRVAAVSSPEDYPEVLARLKSGQGSLALADRLDLARKTFRRIVEYDVAISEYLSSWSGDPGSLYQF